MSQPIGKDPVPPEMKKYSGRPLPRNIRRALDANDQLRVELSISMALDKGWSEEDLTEAFNWYKMWRDAKSKAEERDALADLEYIEN